MLLSFKNTGVELSHISIKMYTFGPFSTQHNEYTLEAHKELREQARAAGWTCIKIRYQYADMSRGRVHKWCYDNNIFPLNISYYGELWFEHEKDAVFFKLVFEF